MPSICNTNKAVKGIHANICTTEKLSKDYTSASASQRKESQEYMLASATTEAVKDILAMVLKFMLQLDGMCFFDSFACVADAGRHPRQLMICLLFSNVDSDCAVLLWHLQRVPF